MLIIDQDRDTRAFTDRVLVSARYLFILSLEDKYMREIQKTRF
jgi:hypothetical protein